MVRLTLLLILIIVVIWILRPFLRTKDTSNKTLNADDSKLKHTITIYIIVALVVLLGLVVFIFPKFGTSFLSLLQKLIPVISSLRGILPF